MKVENWKLFAADPEDPHRKRMMQLANVPQRKWDASLALAHGSAADEVRTYLDDLRGNVERGDGMMLYGDYRVGKSCLAACVLREVVAHRARAYWLDASDLADCWERRDDYFVTARSSHFLVIDDLGIEGYAPFRKEMVGRALRYRLERAMTTVVTTNMAPAELKDHYGPKVHALLREILGTPIEVKEWKGDSVKAAAAEKAAAEAEAAKGRRLAEQQAREKERTEKARLRIKGDRNG